jgi:2-aminomuconate deaminase
LGSDGAITHAGDVEAQSRVVFGRLKQILAKDDATLNDIVKINIFIVGDDDQIEGIFHTASRVWAEIAPDAHPAMTPVRVHELARPGALIQADCIAIKE